MPSPTYVALAKTVLTGSQLTVTFSSIPSTYTDLLVLVSARTDQAGTDVNAYVTLNSSTSNYSDTYLYGSSTSALSGRDTAQAQFLYATYANGASTTSNTFTNVELYIPNYAGSTNKIISSTTVLESNSASVNVIVPAANLLSNTAAISSITFDLAGSNNYLSGSRFDLYGIKNS